MHFVMLLIVAILAGVAEADGDLDRAEPIASVANDHLVFGIASSFDCDEQGVEPGDTITLVGTRRGAIRFSNCFGAPGKEITIRNDASESERLVVSAEGSTVPVVCNNCQYVILDGTGKWSGAPAGSCGLTIAGRKWTFGRTQCGIRLTSTGAPVAFIRFTGSSRFFTIRGIEVDGSGAGPPGIGIFTNDNAYTRTEHPDEWREGITITQNYIHDTATEGLYLGHNRAPGVAGEDNLDLRNVTVSRNIIETTGRQAINIKSALEGRNRVFHNYLRDAGNEKATQVVEYKDSVVDHYENWTQEGPNGCVAWVGSETEEHFGDFEVSARGNVLVDCGRNGFRIGSLSRNDSYVPAIYDNTIVRMGAGKCIFIDTAVRQVGIVRDNICAGAVDP